MFYSVQTHKDIDYKKRAHVSLSAWQQFLDWFDKIINKRALLEKSDEVNTSVRATIGSRNRSFRESTDLSKKYIGIYRSS